MGIFADTTFAPVRETSKAKVLTGQTLAMEYQADVGGDLLIREVQLLAIILLSGSTPVDRLFRTYSPALKRAEAKLYSNWLRALFLVKGEPRDMVREASLVADAAVVLELIRLKYGVSALARRSTDPGTLPAGISCSGTLKTAPERLSTAIY